MNQLTKYLKLIILYIIIPSICGCTQTIAGSIENKVYNAMEREILISQIIIEYYKYNEKWPLNYEDLLYFFNNDMNKEIKINWNKYEKIKLTPLENKKLKVEMYFKIEGKAFKPKQKPDSTIEIDNPNISNSKMLFDSDHLKSDSEKDQRDINTENKIIKF